MDNVDTAGASRLPVACTLELHDGAERMRRWQALSERGQPNARLVGHRLVVRYLPKPGVREELEALATAERECCPFVAWTVDQDEDQPILYVTADPNAPEDVAPIAALFGAG